MWFKDKKDFDNHLNKNIGNIFGREAIIIPPKVYNIIKEWEDFEIIDNQPYYKKYPIDIIKIGVM